MQQINEMSAHKRVTKGTPPTFIFYTLLDKAVSLENSLLFAEAMNREGNPFVLKVQKDGKHGVGMGGWINDLEPRLLNISRKNPVDVVELSMETWRLEEEYVQQNYIFN